MPRAEIRNLGLFYGTNAENRVIRVEIKCQECRVVF